MIKMKLHDICRPKQWKTLSTSVLLDDGYPVYGANGIIGFYSEYTHKEPTLMITCRGATCGSLHISKPYSYINGNAMALDNLDKSVDIKYLYFYLKYRGFNDVITGSAQPQITGQSLEKISLNIPSFSTQTQIAQILDKSTALIAKRKAQIAELDKLVQSIFLEMFGDPITNPKKWEMGKFADICELNPKSEKYDDNLDVSFIPMQLVSENSHKVSFEIKKYKQVKKGFTPFIEGDVLFAKITPCMENGKAGIAQQLKNNIGFGSTEFHVFRPKYVEYSSFIYSLVHLPLFRELCSKHFSGSAGHKRVPKDFLENFNLYLPIFEQIQHFEKIFEKIHAQKSLLQKSLAELEVQHQALMQKAFNGQLVG